MVAVQSARRRPSRVRWRRRCAWRCCAPAGWLPASARLPHGSAEVSLSPLARMHTLWVTFS